jgi:hypothetical protein
VDELEGKVKELKSSTEEGDAHRTAGENLTRKVQLLEEELDKAEKDLRETTEKWVFWLIDLWSFVGRVGRPPEDGVGSVCA